MARDFRKVRNRRESGNFAIIPHCVLESENWRRCGGSAVKLLLELARQFRGNNNGDLCASISVLKPRGWRSSDVLGRALAELRYYGFIELTRQGGLHCSASLYALAWRAIDHCGGKLEVPATTTASHAYRTPKPRYRPPKRAAKASPESRERSAGNRISRKAA